MEGNKDDALKCLKFAEKFIASGNKEKAFKFLNKSVKLYPTPKAEALLTSLQQDSNNCNGNSSDHTATTRQRKRTNSNSRHEKDETPPAPRNYTEEQVKEVLRIKNYEDFYEVLGVNKDFTESELKKAYRKLALQFHPDKNQAPGADEAFKRIGTAFSVLNDSEKRQRYDRYGENLGPSQMNRRRNYHEDDFEGDISPEDLFNMFFGGGMPSGRVYMNRRFNNQANHYHGGHQQREQNASSMYPLVQILPILLIILFSLLSSLLIPEPVYSFQQTSQYRYPVTTANYGITYYIKDSSLRSKYSPSQYGELERKIERDFIENLQVRCYRERQHRAEIAHQARLWGSSDMAARARDYVMHSCNQLHDLGVQ